MQPEKERKDFRQIGEYPSSRPGMPGAPRYSYVISEAENIKRTVFQKKPLYQPTNRDYLTLAPRIHPDNLARGFVVDANPVSREQYGGKDAFGIPWVYVDSVGGSMVVPGDPTLANANDWPQVIRFPDVSQWDWERESRANDPLYDAHRLTSVWIMNGLFERLISFMDYAPAAMALIDEEQTAAVLALFDRLADFYIDLMEHYRRYYHAGIIYFHDDWGSQNGPIFSLETALRMLVPALRKISDACHKMGMIFEMHSCGRNELLVPAYIAGGADIWAGQPMNDFDKLYDLYGYQIILGVPCPVPETAAREECRELVRNFLNRYQMKGPVIAGLPFGPINPFLREELYLQSRALLGG